MSDTTRNLSLLVLTGLILTFALAFYQLIQPFLLPLFLASIITIVVRPMNDYFRRRLWNRKDLAALATTSSFLAIILLPLIFGVFVGSVQLYDWSQKFFDQIVAQEVAPGEDQPQFKIHPVIKQRFDTGLEKVRLIVAPASKDNPTFRRDIAQRAREFAQTLAQKTPGMLGTAFSALVGIGIVVLALYFFLADGDTFVLAAEQLFPLQAEYQRRFRLRFVTVTRAVVLGTFLAAVGQGVATGLALWFAGFDQFILLTILAILSAVIPFVGTMLVWVPCATWLAVLDWQANSTTVIVLVLFQIVVVGMLDNLIRAYVLNSDVKLHPLLALLSVLGGLQWLGLWGVFIGPLVASCLHALIEIFHEELNSPRGEGPPVIADPPAA